MTARAFAFGAAMSVAVLVGLAWLLAPDVQAQTIEFPQTCNYPAYRVTAVATSATTVPTTKLTGRRLMLVCNSPENTGSGTVKCRLDGVNPITVPATTYASLSGSGGEVLGKGSCLTYNVTGRGQWSAVLCTASASDTLVNTVECK